MIISTTTAFGIEAVTARELKWLGYEDLKVTNGEVSFEGDFLAVAKANLWLRTAERVFIKLGEFKVETFDNLFEGTKALPWEDFIDENGEFPVTGTSVKSKLFSISDCQSIVKKAIVERLKTKYDRQIFEENGARYKVRFSILNDIASLYLDTSGDGLHKRGYRKLVTKAPIKETFAAALIMISRWKKDRALIDPFCGSGTIPIEAALIGMNMAPGINRDFDFLSWGCFDNTLWDDLIDEAYSLLDENIELRIQGTDIDEECISIARYHSKLAGVEKHIHFQQRDMKEVSSRFKYGFIICNPPYGERLGETPQVIQLYKKMGEVFNKLETWSYYIITSYEEFEKEFGRKADKKRKLYNGRIKCDYYQYFGEKPQFDKT